MEKIFRESFPRCFLRDLFYFVRKCPFFLLRLYSYSWIWIQILSSSSSGVCSCVGVLPPLPRHCYNPCLWLCQSGAFSNWKIHFFVGLLFGRQTIFSFIAVRSSSMLYCEGAFLNRIYVSLRCFDPRSRSRWRSFFAACNAGWLPFGCLLLKLAFFRSQ